MKTEKKLEQVVNYPLVVGDQTVRVTALEMGNPCVVFLSTLLGA